VFYRLRVIEADASACAVERRIADVACATATLRRRWAMVGPHRPQGAARPILSQAVLSIAVPTCGGRAAFAGAAEAASSASPSWSGAPLTSFVSLGTEVARSLAVCDAVMLEMFMMPLGGHMASGSTSHGTLTRA